MTPKRGRTMTADVDLSHKIAAAPPSAPVGVEWNDEAAWSLAARAEAAGAERDSDDNGTWWTLRIDHFNALAHHPEIVAALNAAKAHGEPNAA